MPPAIHYSLSSIHCPAARHYHPTLSIWLSVDPMSDKYPGVSPYTYCGNNPVMLKDPDGEEIYLLFYTEEANCFKASAETRKYNIEHSKSFNPQKDKVFIFAISNLADIESRVNETIAQYSEQYGKTAEFGIWSHAGFDGPRGAQTTSGDYSYGSQMKIAGWGRIHFNWSSDATATFYGCNTAAQNSETESFAQQISQLDNFYNVQVRGQQSGAYPSTNPHWRSINAYHIIGWFSSKSTYMVGGRKNKGYAAIFGGDYAYPLSCFKNGRGQGTTYQSTK
ncbi:MAG: hypothetical protein IJP65_01380 [Bacteroidales bacterium]|nr:hypothetical protein [Bacteroidales bacterium]